MVEVRDFRAKSSLEIHRRGYPSAYTLQVPYTGAYQEITSVRTGSFTPGKFRANPVTIRKETHEVREGEYVRKVNGIIVDQVIGSFGLAYVGGLGTVSWDPLLAKGSILEAIAESRSAKHDIGLVLGELSETVAMLVSPLKALYKAFVKTKKVGLTKLSKRQLEEFGSRWPVDTAKVSAGLWLTTRYGILPLMSDISMLLDLLNNGIEEQSNRLRRAKGGVSHTRNSRKDISNYPNGIYSWASGTVTDELSTTTSIYYRVDGSELWKKARSLGLSPYQIPGLLWELVPLSFVLDWFVDVNSYIRAVFPDPKTLTVGSCTSQKSKRTVSCEVLRGHLYGDYSGLIQAPSYRGIAEQLVRVVNAPQPVLPVFNRRPLNLLRSIDSVALMLMLCSNLLPKR